MLAPRRGLYPPVWNLASIQKVDLRLHQTSSDIMSMDVICSKVLQAYLRYHLRGGVVTLLRGVIGSPSSKNEQRSLRASSPIWARSRVLARLVSLAQIGELALRL